MINFINKLKTAIDSKYFVPALGLVIVTLMFVMLLHGLGSNDSGLHCDEAGIGINSYFLSENLRDENNNLLPLFIKNFVSHKMPVYVYLTAAIVKFSGLSVLTVRLLAAICGAFAAFFLFLLARRYLGNFTAIGSLIFLALTPGFFHIQRIAFELTTFSCFFLGFLYFLSLRIDKKSNYYLIPTFIFFILAWYSYLPTQVFIVAIIGLMLIFNIKAFKKINKQSIKENKLVISSVIIGFILFIVLPFALSINELFGTKHVSGKFLLSKLNPDTEIQLTLDYLNNNYIYYYELIKDLPRHLQLAFISVFNYVNSYSMDFLFFQGDNEIRHIIPKFGPLPLVFLFLVPTGLIVCINNFIKQEYKFLLAAFLAIGAPSAMMATPIELTHNSHMYVFLAALASLGFSYIVLEFIKPIPVKLVVSLLILATTLIPFYKYHQTYFNEYRFEADDSWYAHRDEILYYIRANYPKYDKVYFSNQIHELYAHLVFYSITSGELETEEYQKNKKLPFNMKPIKHNLISPNIQIESIKNVYGNNVLFVVNPKELSEVEDVEVIYYNDGNAVAKFKEIK